MTELHHCRITRHDHLGWMGAITECREDIIGQFHASNSEYYSVVNFCPECGAESPEHKKAREQGK